MQKPINVHLSIRFSNSLCKVQIFKKYLAYFSNMRNMTQNIQNGSFNIKRGSRILIIISAAKRASIHSISSYKRGGTWWRGPPPPPPGSALTCMLKMLLMYFKFVNLILVFWHSWKNLNCNFWTKKAWFPARYVTISVKVKHFWIDEIKFLNFQKIHYHIQKFFVPKYFLCSKLRILLRKTVIFFLTSNFYSYAW